MFKKVLVCMAVGLMLCSCVTVSNSFAESNVEKEGLVGYWTFDEGSGEVAHDKSGNSNDGKIYGAQFVKTGEGYALEFDGKDDFVDCGSGASLNITDEITIEAWIKLKGFEKFATIANKSHQGLMVSESCFFLGFTKKPRPRAGGIGFDLTAGEEIDTGTWYHIAWVRGEQHVLYVNGKKAATRARGGNLKTSAEHLTFGLRRYDVDSSNYPFHGLIDEIAIYNRALTEDTIKQHSKTRH
jgi:hypothetical protein